MAYGQTSSGKTHTMLGTVDEIGVSQLACEHLFARLPAHSLVRVSYLEIYQESVKDLLQPETGPLDVYVTEKVRSATKNGGSAGALGAALFAAFPCCPRWW